MKTCEECLEEIREAQTWCDDCAAIRKLEAACRSKARVFKEKGAVMVRKNEYFTPERIKKLAEDGSYQENTSDDSWMGAL